MTLLAGAARIVQKQLNHAHKDSASTTETDGKKETSRRKEEERKKVARMFPMVLCVRDTHYVKVV